MDNVGDFNLAAILLLTQPGLVQGIGVGMLLGETVVVVTSRVGKRGQY